MALGLLVIGLALIGVVSIWSSTKLLKWSLGDSDVQIPVGYPWQIGRTVAVLMVVVYLWSGLAHWAAEAWAYVPIP